MFMNQFNKVLLDDFLQNILFKVVQKQTLIQLSPKFVLWIKAEELSLEDPMDPSHCPPSQEKKLSTHFLRVATLGRHEQALENIPQFKDKYNQYKEIMAFVGRQPPVILQLTNHDAIIICKNRQEQKVFHYSHSGSRIAQIEVIPLDALVQIDHYNPGTIYILTKLEFRKYHLQKNGFVLLAQRIIPPIPTPLFQLAYNQYYHLIITEYELVILPLEGNSPIEHIPTPQTPPNATLYFFPPFQQQNIPYFIIQSRSKVIQISQTKPLQELSIKFSIKLNQITQLSIDQIKRVFLLEFIALLPRISKFSLWPANNFDAVKELITQNISPLHLGHLATCSLIYALKFDPGLVYGIVAYLEYYCFFVHFPLQQLMRAIFEWLPGYRKGSEAAWEHLYRLTL